MDEFAAIEKYFAPLTMGREEAAGLQDDAAVLAVPEGCELVVTSDTLNEGVHFVEGEAPDVIARKALRVNLSDLAAMGAKPLCYQLNIAFPKPPEGAWLKAFSGALLEENRLYDVFCSGGDTTGIKSEGLSISVTAFGVVPKGKAVRRGGAKDGDFIVLTGPVGDAALGLKQVLAGKNDYEEAVERYRVPPPRVGIEDVLCSYVNAAADISDGLIADCLHIAHASGLGADIDLEALVFSNSVQSAIENKEITAEEAASGGDDYELILAVSGKNLKILISELKKNKLNPLVIGRFAENGLKNSAKSNESLRIDDLSVGWKHF